MKKDLKIIPLLILGTLVGLIIHGIIEIPALWFLTNKLNSLFTQVPWNTWLKIHLIYTIITEIVGIALVSLVYKKFIQKKNNFCCLPEITIILLFVVPIIIVLISILLCPNSNPFK